MSEVTTLRRPDQELSREKLPEAIAEILMHSLTVDFEPIEQDLFVTRPLKLGRRIFDGQCIHDCYLNIMRQDDKKGPKKLIVKKFAVEIEGADCHPNKTAITKYQEIINGEVRKLRGFDTTEPTTLDRDLIFGLKNSRVGSKSTPAEDIAMTLRNIDYIRLFLESTIHPNSDRFFFPEDDLS